MTRTRSMSEAATESGSYGGLFHDNPIIYYVMTDRFARGPRHPDEQCQPFEPRTSSRSAVGEFHGGNFAGITSKLETGWFNALGVNALIISAPYQQILGWVPGAGNEFKHYAYHGYYALDYTVVERRFGTERDFAELVRVAHDAGICVLLDVVLNHPGYPDLLSLSQLQIPVVKSGWELASPEQFHDFLDYDSPAFAQWWGPDWVRAALPGYEPGGDDDLTMLVHNLPDFKTECEEAVELPEFFAKCNETRAVPIPDASVRTYLIRWLTDWIRRFGVDGFRCDSAKHVELDVWFELKRASSAALEDHLASTAQLPHARDNVWMLGEVFGQRAEASHYFDFGFDSLLNFGFQTDLAAGRMLDDIYAEYAALLGGRPGFDFVSYISSQDTYLFDRARIKDAATALMLAPGGVLIFYGDESARAPGPFFPSDPMQATRSNMNWDSVEPALLAHWQQLGQFRARHVALARGEHLCLNDGPYVFARTDRFSGDRIVAVPDAVGDLSIPVSPVFDDGQWLHDAYSGWRGQVMNGRVTLRATGVVLLELGKEENGTNRV